MRRGERLRRGGGGEGEGRVRGEEVKEGRVRRRGRGGGEGEEEGRERRGGRGGGEVEEDGRERGCTVQIVCYTILYTLDYI